MANQTNPKKKWTRRSTARSFTLYPGDLELINWAAEQIGCSQSELVRTAVRSYIMHLEIVNRRAKPGRKSETSRQAGRPSESPAAPPQEEADAQDRLSGSA